MCLVKLYYIKGSRSSIELIVIGRKEEAKQNQTPDKWEYVDKHGNFENMVKTEHNKHCIYKRKNKHTTINNADNTKNPEFRQILRYTLNKCK